MIKVTHQYHYVKADAHIRHRWTILMFKAYAAYALGDMTSYNKLSQIVRNEYSQWKTNTEKECNQKSKKNWLGGGETYIVTESDPIEDNKRFLSIFQNSTANEIFAALQQMEANNWMDLYSPT